jgi:biotin carboxyl carrier protein
MDNCEPAQNDEIDMNLRIKIKGREYNVELNEIGGKVIISIDGKEYAFDDNGTSAQIERVENGLNLQAAVIGSSSKEIVAPMAGIISEVFVKKGDKIKIAQKLLTLSAMKMENELLAESEGVVKEVLIEKDKKVATGEKLIILE